MEEVPVALNLANKGIKKLNKSKADEAQAVTSLILDDNELQRLDNIDSFPKLQKLSIERNQLLRMYGVCRLQNLHTLNLAHNGILTIEGLKDLVHLRWLCLAGNNIKTIEHLNTNVKLEHLDLSENSLTHLSDLSFLRILKELLLHNNKIIHLLNGDRFLPTSLTTLTLANNNISDLNEISQLVNLTYLTSVSIANNPCVNMTGRAIGFDYRPFVINWCMNVNVIDGYVVDAIESLRAEWLYSQGRGRNFRIGDHKDLVQYLSTVCPLTGEALETEEDRKLRLILSKAQHHQQQLRDQSNGETPTPSPVTRKKLHGIKDSPRLNSPRLNMKSRSPDRMSSSFHSTNNKFDNSSIMSQSLDPTMFRQNNSRSASEMSNSVIFEKCLDAEPINSPLQALSKMVPVPESLMSPDCAPPNFINKMIPQQNVSLNKNQATRSPKTPRAASRKSSLTNDARKTGSPSPVRHKKPLSITSKITPSKTESPTKSALKKSASSESESEMCDSKLQTIQLKVEKRKQKIQVPKDNKVEKAAVCIQKHWRGFFIRNKNKEVQELFKTLQSQRANQYIQKLASDVENTKAALESERKIQMLQTEAISALWKKVSSLQPDSQESTSQENGICKLNPTENAQVVKQLAQTCSALQNQVSQLQNSMQDILKVVTLFSQTAGITQPVCNENVIATQTEIVAVHTPQGEAAKSFPFSKQTQRPSSLPLPVHQRKKENVTHQEVRQFAGSLVDGVIKTVSETKADNMGHSTTEITVTHIDKDIQEGELDNFSVNVDL